MLKTTDEKALFGMDKAELTSVMAGFGQKAYRAQQVFDALYKQRVAALDEVTTLPTALRSLLEEQGWRVGLPVMAQTAVSVDGTERYLMRMGDGSGWNSELCRVIWPDESRRRRMRCGVLGWKELERLRSCEMTASRSKVKLK